MQSESSFDGVTDELAHANANAVQPQGCKKQGGFANAPSTTGHSAAKP